MAPRQYGYIRVSDKDQNEARQVIAMQDAGIDERFILLDKQSGKDFNRPQYQILKNALRDGDLLVIKSIDRLGRNYKEILKEWQVITQDIKADIKVLDMALLDTTLYKDLLGTFISDLMLQVLAYVAQQERDNTKVRQREGINAAIARGQHLGRPKAEYPCDWDIIYKKWKDKEYTAKKAMDITCLKRTTFYKLADKYEQSIKKS